MAELPEVEAWAHLLRDLAAGREIERVDAAALSIVKTFEPPISALQGRRIDRIGRAGAYLLLDCESLFLVLGFGARGRLRWSGELSPRPVRAGRRGPVLRVHLDAAGGGGGFDVSGPAAGRGRAGVSAWVVTDPLDVAAVSSLGPDAASVGPGGLADALGSAGDRSLAEALVDESVVAGLGADCVEAILARSGTEPSAPAARLDTDEVESLHAAMQQVLEESVRGRVAAMDSSRGYPAASSPRR